MFKHNEIDDDILRFKPDSLGYAFCMGFIILNAILTIYCTSLMEYNIRIFIFSIFNIVLTLFLFLTAEQIKNYHLNWSYVLLGLGVFQLIRISFMPPKTGNAFSICFYVFSGVMGILAGGISLYKSIRRKRQVQKKENR